MAEQDSAPALLRTIMGWPEVVRFWLPAWVHERAAMPGRVDEALIRAEVVCVELMVRARAGMPVAELSDVESL
ncbi:hypothetical protein [Micromonospora sp. NPDC000668]|uniref:hypothetical protein n=1 Tax=Micromonospora sp. NPDC000668 TaxID=3364219 RepID=UPI00367AEAD8